jgi:hypothetical protein
MIVRYQIGAIEPVAAADLHDLPAPEPPHRPPIA